MAQPNMTGGSSSAGGISESRLPPGSEIYFREPTLWDKYRWYIALLVAVLLAQVGLIIVLVSERRHRLYFEVQASRRAAELAHFNRYSTGWPTDRNR